MPAQESQAQWDWFGYRLRELRESAGLSRPELAARARMRSEAGIRNIEQGLSSPTWETVLRLAKALGVSCEAFTHAPAGGPAEPRRGRPRKQPADATPATPSGEKPAARLPKKGKE